MNEIDTPCDIPDDDGVFRCPYTDYTGYEDEKCRVCCGLGVDENDSPQESEDEE